MARERGGDQAPAPVAAEGAARGSRELLMSVPLLRGPGASESLTTVLVAFGANVLVAAAKSAAAAVTGSASLVAEAFVLEGISFLQSVRQARSEAGSLQRDLIEHVMATSDPTLRAVFAEDSAALTGLVIAAAGLAAHQLTGSP